MIDLTLSLDHFTHSHTHFHFRVLHLGSFVARHLFVMSSIYVLEPPTNAKVVLSTSYGDVEMELWAKVRCAARRHVRLRGCIRAMLHRLRRTENAIAARALWRATHRVMR